MTGVLAILVALLSSTSPVREVSVTPVEDRTEIAIAFDREVEVSDFRLQGPDRLVLDISGAHQSLPRTQYLDIDRGGIRALRVSQYEPNVVRLVFDLSSPVDYSIENLAGLVRLTFPNSTGPFVPWRVSSSVAPTQPPVRPVQRPQPRITVFFRSTPISDAIATFAEFSRRSIIMGRGVTGTVDADIRDQPWDIALEALLAAHGFSAQEMESGIIRVDRIENLREQEKVEELVTRPFAIRYASVDSLLPTITGLLSDRGRATKSSATNTIVVTDGRSVVDGRIAPMIEQLDARTPQVEISAKIIFINRTALEELGVSYELQDRSTPLGALLPGDELPVGLSGTAIAALGNATADSRVAGPSIRFISSILSGSYRLNAFIDALSSMSVADIEARPVVRTLDHREASIQVGEETPIRVVDAGSQTGVGTARANVQFKNTGVILRVTPHVTGDQVLLEVHAERSGIQPMAEADLGFTFQKQEAKNHILVNNGETAVVGGLTIVEKTRSRVGVPLLKDIPLLGLLFRKSLEREEKKDLLIMITPHIIRDGL